MVKDGSRPYPAEVAARIHLLRIRTGRASYVSSLSAAGFEPATDLVGGGHPGDAGPARASDMMDSTRQTLPHQRQATGGALVDTPATRPATTAVLPYVGSPSSERTRWLRAWMITAPVDLAAMLAPLAVSDRYWRGTLFTAGLTICIFAAGGLYRARRHISILDELPSLCGRLLASGAIVGIVAALRHDSVGYVAGFMRGVALSAGLVLVGRTLTRTIVLVARRHRWVEQNAIILGSGPIAAELARLLRRYPQYGLHYVGCVDEVPQSADSPPLLSSLDELEETITITECAVIIIADTGCPESRLMEILRRPTCASRDLWVVPRLWGSRSQGGVPDHIGAIPVVHLRHTSLSGPRWAVKRASDILFASIALIVLSPIIVLCALLAFIDGGPRIFFRQERIGRYGKRFQLIKFRSMQPANEHEAQTNWSIADDRRVSPIGRFLRRTSLDELPQLWNILRGDMTVVGPRPERPYFVEKFSAEHPDYAMRHRVPVGLTGLAQVSGLRGDTPISDRARFDNYYIENWSLWLDIKVLLRTVAEVFRVRGR
jgi:exopolysaccharide biosynthesis polyprenyl glycosylphosphotransferase